MAISGHSALTLGLVFVLLWESNIIADLTGGGAQAVMWPMGTGCKYRWNLAGLLTSAVWPGSQQATAKYWLVAWGLGYPWSKKCLSRDLKKQRTQILANFVHLFWGTFITGNCKSIYELVIYFSSCFTSLVFMYYRAELFPFLSTEPSYQ